MKIFNRRLRFSLFVPINTINKHHMFEDIFFKNLDIKGSFSIFSLIISCYLKSFFKFFIDKNLEIQISLIENIFKKYIKT